MLFYILFLYLLVSFSNFTFYVLLSLPVTSCYINFLSPSLFLYSLDWQNYLIISTVDYLLRIQESMMDFYWHYSGKDTIDEAGKANFIRAIKVGKQLFAALTEYIQVCILHPGVCSTSRCVFYIQVCILHPSVCSTSRCVFYIQVCVLHPGVCVLHPGVCSTSRCTLRCLY